MYTGVTKGFQLSPQQKRLSMQQGSVPGARCVLLIEGDLSPRMLWEAVQRVIKRHEILRTSFGRLPSMIVPVQMVNDTGSPLWREERTASLQTRIEQVLHEEEQSPFNLEMSSPARFVLLNSVDKHALIISLPSLCADSITLFNLSAEIGRAYEANGTESEAVQYLQYAEWQNELLAEETPEAAQEYWREVAQRYESAASLRLPLEPQSARGDFRPQSVRRRLEVTMPQLEVTPRAFWLSCWLLLLQRLTGAERVVTGCVFDGRVYEELQAALGPYARALPVGAEFDHGISFAELCRQVERGLEESEEWQHYYRAEETHKFGFEYVEVAEEQTGAVRVRLERWTHWVEANKVQLRCERWADGEVVVELGYDAALYEREQMERLAERYEQVVRTVVHEEVKDVRAVEVVGAAERRQLIEEWSAGSDVAVESGSVVEMFEAAVRSAGAERMAVESEEGRLSYEELNERANRLGRYLRAECGVQSEEVVAVALGRGLWQVVAILGVLKAGGAYLPLDVVLPEARLELMLGEAGVRVLLTEQRLRERFPKLAHVLALDSKWEASVASQAATDLDEKPRANNLAYVIYTSGSTGTPKAVMIEHGAVLNLVAALHARIYERLGPGQRVSLNAPLHFDASVKQLMQLTCGHTLCVVPEAVRLDGAAMRAWVKEQAVTVLDCTPSQLRLLLEGAAPDWMMGTVLVGGEAIDERVWQQLREQVGVKYYNVYGPTECTVDATSCAVDEAEAPVLGRALPGVRVYVLDQRQRLAPIGVAGELYIGGRGVGRGYLNRGDLTAERYVPDEWSGEIGARLYATGDMVRYVEGGELEYVGRADRQVKVRGHRVELGEIETVLTSHAGVAAAVVELGSEEQLLAYVVTHGNGVTKELREHVRSRLPDYMTPGRYIEIATMPLTRSGKVDREALRSLAESNGHSELDEPIHTRPRTPVEEVLTGFWAEILGIDHVNVDANFFELGGHSLLVTRIISRVRKVFQVEVPILSLFESPTVSGLAAVIEKNLKSSNAPQTTSLERINRNGEIPLSFSQQRLWFLQQLTPNSTAYHLPSSFRLTGALNVDVLEQTLHEIITRHEVLRTTFATVDSRPVQNINPPAPPAVTKLDLSDLPDHEREQEVRRQALDEATRPFDLAHGPLLRATLLRLGDCEHVVLFTMHHIASDEWSMGILVREVAMLYESFLEGRPSPLPELPIQYADYATWQRGQMHGEVLEANMKYWRERLGGELPVLKLPTDRPRPPLQTFRGAMRSIVLPLTLLKALRTLSRKEGVTVFMTLLGAFQTLLHRYSGQEDILTGTPIANRNRLETEGLIGFFVNTLVMRTDLSRDPTFSELLARVREDALGAYAHQDLPFEKLVEDLKPKRDLSRNPIFQVAFTYESSPREALSLPGITLSPLESEYVSVRFDLVVLVSERDEGLKVAFNYNTDLFNEATINKMLAFYELILQNVVTQPEIKLSRLVAIVNDAEREQQAARQKEFKEARRRMLQNLKPKLTEAEGVI